MFYDPTMLQKARQAQLEARPVDVEVFCTYLRDKPFGNLRFHPLIMGGEVVAIIVALTPCGGDEYFGAVLPAPFYNTDLWTTLGMLYGRYQERLAQRRQLLEASYGSKSATRPGTVSGGEGLHLPTRLPALHDDGLVQRNV